MSEPTRDTTPDWMDEPGSSMARCANCGHRRLNHARVGEKRICWALGTCQCPGFAKVSLSSAPPPEAQSGTTTDDDYYRLLFDRLCGVGYWDSTRHVREANRTARSAITGAHPEDFCERCGRQNVTWFAPSELWNQAARTPDTDPMLCPVCFIRAAEAIGIGQQGAWRVAPESFNGMDQRERNTTESLATLREAVRRISVDDVEHLDFAASAIVKRRDGLGPDPDVFKRIAEQLRALRGLTEEGSRDG